MLRKVLLILILATGVSAQSLIVSVADVYPSQTRFSSRNVARKVEKIAERGTFSDVMVVKASFGYVLVDGHHHVLAALELGYQELPVYVLEDLSHLDEESFWCHAMSRGLAYVDQDEERPHFSTMQDDPNRYFAAITARRFDEMERCWFGAEYPLWVKVGKDIPFIELKIADALHECGLVYSYEMGEEPPTAFVEAARKVLLDANIEGLRVVPVRMHYKEYEEICSDLRHDCLADVSTISFPYN